MTPYPPGTRIRKTNSEHGDAHGDGALARVVEHLGYHPESDEHGYMVVWDDTPGLQVFVRGKRIEAAGA